MISEVLRGVGDGSGGGVGARLWEKWVGELLFV